MVRKTSKLTNSLHFHIHVGPWLNGILGLPKTIKSAALAFLKMKGRGFGFKNLLWFESPDGSIHKDVQDILDIFEEMMFIHYQ